jgi:hypothetical protein
LEKVENPYVGVFHVLKIFKEGGSMESQEKYVTRLVYVQAKLNGKSMVVMVDSGTNHHFIREDTMKILRLQPEPM